MACPVLNSEFYPFSAHFYVLDVRKNLAQSSINSYPIGKIPFGTYPNQRQQMRALATLFPSDKWKPFI
jgi:hypothetical protein